MKTLVAYFSASGTTEGVAKKVAEAKRSRSVRDQTRSTIYKCRPELDG